MNNFTTQLFYFLLSSSCIFFLHAMEIQKPIIEGFIYPKGPLGYQTQEYHNNFHSITNIYSTIFTPIIEINVFYVDKEGYPVEFDWTKGTPSKISKYENWNKSSDNKKFPQYAPITLFYNKQEGDILSLSVYGYEAHLTCTSQLPLIYFKQPEGQGLLYIYDKTRTTAENNFNTLFNFHINNFKNASVD